MLPTLLLSTPAIPSYAERSWGGVMFAQVEHLEEDFDHLRSRGLVKYTHFLVVSFKFYLPLI